MTYCLLSLSFKAISRLLRSGFYPNPHPMILKLFFPRAMIICYFSKLKALLLHLSAAFDITEHLLSLEARPTFLIEERLGFPLPMTLAFLSIFPSSLSVSLSAQISQLSLIQGTQSFCSSAFTFTHLITTSR